jgi:hypothetical protein
MEPFAAVVLTHADPVHLQRLVAALDDVPIFLHCDAKTPASVHARMVDRLPNRVHRLPRVRTSLASWSLVEAELSCLRAAVKRTTAQHIAVLSGACYPLMSMQDLHEELSKWAGSSWLPNVPLPHPPWSTPRNPDGGMWRVQHRFLTWRHQLLFVRGVPLRWPVRRDVPPGLELRAAAQWKIYSRAHAQLLLDLVDKRPDLVRFWQSTLVPEESFAASMLASRAFLGAEALPACYDQAWHMEWADDDQHPVWLTSAHFADLAAARNAEPSYPATAFQGTEERFDCRKLFARKFSSSVDTDVLDRVDRELRG